MDHNSKEFKALQDKWYKKLEKSGFEDIEDVNTDTLHEWHSTIFKNKNSTSAEISTSYYYQATHFLNDYKFSSKAEKRLWELHSQGIGGNKINQILKHEKYVYSRKDEVINKTIKKLAAQMQKLYSSNNDE